MDAVLYVFTILERKLFIPVSEETGLSVDKVSFVLHSLLINAFPFVPADSLCHPNFCFYISWIFYEIRVTSIESQ